MRHELRKLTMSDSDASVHVCPLNDGQGNGFRKASDTSQLPGAGTCRQRRNATDELLQ